MSPGRLEVVKQVMTRVNINILRISELKWIGMDEFNSRDHLIYHCGQETCMQVRKQQLELDMEQQEIGNRTMSFSK